jgi:hypothetical protein
VGPRAGLDAVTKRKDSYHCPCRELNSLQTVGSSLDLGSSVEFVRTIGACKWSLTDFLVKILYTSRVSTGVTHPVYTWTRLS